MKFRKLTESVIHEPQNAVGYRAFYTSGVWKSEYLYFEKYKTRDECLEAALRWCDSSNHFEIQYIIPGINDPGCKNGASKGTAYQFLYVTFNHGIPKIDCLDSRVKYDGIHNRMYLDKGQQYATGSTYREKGVNEISLILQQRGFEPLGWSRGVYHMKQETNSGKIMLHAHIGEGKNYYLYRCTVSRILAKTHKCIGQIDLPYNMDSDRSKKKFIKDLDEFLADTNIQQSTEYDPVDRYGKLNDIFVVDEHMSLSQLMKRFRVFTDNYELDQGEIHIAEDVPFLDVEQFIDSVKSNYKITTFSSRYNIVSGTSRSYEGYRFYK